MNPRLKSQGLDLTLPGAMHCGKPVLGLNFPSKMGTVVLNRGLGFTYSANINSLIEALELAIGDGQEVMR